ncbi:hypothetical protein [Arthrobacter sp. Leaf69]|uniref:hypothetical protein n=1 Tax=Arthrobacter sp. Leaf69 TaxID=1736232 RepID=UPI001910D3AF|nr:hypothetical protein [Arthrobacter sp. Leaf69]
MPVALIRRTPKISGCEQSTRQGRQVGKTGEPLLGVLSPNYRVRPLEESDLKKRFGEEFQQYRDTVRCWIHHP